MAELTGNYATIAEDMLNSDIEQFQNLQVFEEQGILINNNRVKFEFGNWVSDYERTRFLIIEEGMSAQEIIDRSYYVIDYNDGIVTFNPAWRSIGFADRIMGRYSFRYFSNDDITRFINQTKYELDMLKSTTLYGSLDDVPNEWLFVISLGTYIKMVRKLMLDQLIWKNRFIFGDFNVTQTMLSNAFQNANSEFTYYKDILKRRREKIDPRIVMDYPVRFTYLPAGDGTLRFVGKYIA